MGNKNFEFLKMSRIGFINEGGVDATRALILNIKNSIIIAALD